MLFRLLSLPVALPAAGIRFCLQQVLNAAEAELMDPERLKEELLLLQLKLEEGELTEEEYAAREAALMQRWREVRAYRARRLGEQRPAPAAPAASPAGAVVQWNGEPLAGEEQR